MLRNIPKIIPPELVKTMMEMGHSDVLIIADANFPGTAHAKKIIRMDGIMIPELLEAVLQLFPLDNFCLLYTSALQQIPFGHKVALCDMEEGDQILKYGVCIGIATKKIRKMCIRDRSEYV